MDIRKIKKLIELLEESGLAEIEITEGEESVRIARATQGPPVATQTVPIHAPAAVPPAASQAPAYVANERRSRSIRRRGSDPTARVILLMARAFRRPS